KKPSYNVHCKEEEMRLPSADSTVPTGQSVGYYPRPSSMSINLKPVTLLRKFKVQECLRRHQSPNERAAALPKNKQTSLKFFDLHDLFELESCYDAAQYITACRLSQGSCRKRPDKAILVTSSDSSSGLSRPCGLYHRDSHRIIPSRLNVAAVTSRSLSLPSSFSFESASRMRFT